MTEEDLKQFLEDNKADIQAQVRQKLIDGLLNDYSWTMRENISGVVQEFIKEQIAPEVRKHLESEKSAILEAAIKATAGIGEMLQKAMVERAVKNIEANSYNFKETLSAIFK